MKYNLLLETRSNRIGTVEGKSFAEVWNTYLFEEEEESRAGAAVAGEAGAGASAVAAGR